jgi:hypothetical protein
MVISKGLKDIVLRDLDCDSRAHAMVNQASVAGDDLIDRAALAILQGLNANPGPGRIDVVTAWEHAVAFVKARAEVVGREWASVSSIIVLEIGMKMNFLRMEIISVSVILAKSDF